MIRSRTLKYSVLTIALIWGMQGPAAAQNFNGINSPSGNPNAATAGQGQDAGAYAAPAAQPASSTPPAAGQAGTVRGAMDASAYEAATRSPRGSGAPQQYAFKVVAGDQGSKYTLGPTDVVEVTVLRHPEVSGLYAINSEGKIQYEFVGDVEISGMTKEDAAAVLSKKLETYIVHPEVTVIIKEYNSKVVYVVGEVGLPGKVFMRGDTITVRDALLAANLPQLTAATDNATLFTPSDSGKVEHKKVNVYALLYKGDLRENYVMNPGDTIYLPATLWAKIARFINPVTQPVSQAVGTGGAIKGF